MFSYLGDFIVQWRACAFETEIAHSGQKKPCQNYSVYDNATKLNGHKGVTCKLVTKDFHFACIMHITKNNKVFNPTRPSAKKSFSCHVLEMTFVKPNAVWLPFSLTSQLAMKTIPPTYMTYSFQTLASLCIASSPKQGGSDVNFWLNLVALKIETATKNLIQRVSKSHILFVLSGSI